MTDRAAARAAFLHACHRPGAVEPLPADASFRRYFRLAGTPPALLMDAPPPVEDVRPFIAVAQHLATLHLSAPRILAADPMQGFVLVEDFGDATFTRLLADGHDETALYDLAVDALAALHRAAAASAIDCPAYDLDALLAEAALFVDWYGPAAHRGRQLQPEVRAAYLDAWSAALAGVAGQRETLVLRDYHVDNLMLLPGRSGPSACGLLDFQDARIGARAYDLMSLVEDARRDIAPALRARCLDRYARALGPADPADCAVLAAQRHAKVAGIFVRLWLRDGKPGYLRHIPRVMRLFAGHLGHPALAPVADWLARHYKAPWPDLPTADVLALERGGAGA